MSQSAPSARRLSLATILAFAAGGVPLSAAGIAMQISLQPYLAQDLGVGLVAIGSAFFWVRILDLGVDPVLAVIMDRTRTPLGRYRAWMLAGAPLMMLAVYQLFMAKAGIGVGFLICWLLVYALGSTSMLTLSRSAWSANLVTRYDQRARFYGYLGFIAVIGNVMILITGAVSHYLPAQGRPNNVQLMGWMILALTPICTLLTAVGAPEPISPNAPERRHFPFREYWALVRKPEVLRLFFSQFALSLGPGWMANMYLFFFTAGMRYTEPQAYSLLLAYVLAGVLGAPAIGVVGGWLGKHRTLTGAATLYSLGLCAVLIIPKGDFLAAFPVMIWCGFMGNGFDLMTSAMMADVGDEVRLEQNKERMALLFSMIGLAQKLAAAGAVIIAYPLLAAVGYVPKLGGHNTPAALGGLEAIFIAGPIFWVIVGGLCVLGWKLDARKHAGIRAELEARDTLLAQRAALEGGPV